MDDLKRAQRRAAETRERLEAGKPTLKVRLGELVGVTPAPKSSPVGFGEHQEPSTQEQWEREERVTPLHFDMEGVEILEGETCPKCGKPGKRLSTMAVHAFLSLGQEGDTMVHRYTRRRKEAPPPNPMFEVVGSVGGCKLP